MFALILLYVVLTIIRPQDYMPGLVGVPLLPVVLVLAFGFFVAGRKNLSAPQFLLLPIFLLVLMISEVTNGWMGGTVDQLGKFGPTVIAFFVLATACTSPRRLRVTMGTIVACAAVLALHGIGQAKNGIGWTGTLLGEDGRIQYVGIFNDPNDLGLLFAACVPLAAYLAVRAGWLMKLAWIGALLLILYGTYLTNSRGAMLAVLVLCGGYVWYRRGLVTAAALGAAGLACLKLVSSRMGELDAEEESASGRVDAWYSGLHMFTSHPTFGVGAGNFTEYNDLTAHNSFVLVLAETGFIGFVLWLAFVGYTFWMLANILRHKFDAGGDAALARRWHDERVTALALLLALVGLFTCAFFLSRSYMIVLYFFAAMATGAYIGARERFPELPELRFSRGGWRWVPISVGSIAALFVLVAVLLRTT